MRTCAPGGRRIVQHGNGSINIGGHVGVILTDQAEVLDPAFRHAFRGLAFANKASAVFPVDGLRKRRIKKHGPEFQAHDRAFKGEGEILGLPLFRLFPWIFPDRNAIHPEFVNPRRRARPHQFNGVAHAKIIGSDVNGLRAHRHIRVQERKLRRGIGVWSGASFPGARCAAN